MIYVYDMSMFITIFEWEVQMIYVYDMSMFITIF